MRYHRIALLTLAVSCSALAATTPVGTWKVTAYRYGNGVSAGDAQARSWLGKTVTYSAVRAVSGRDVCLAPRYLGHVRNNDFLLDQYHTSLKSIGIRGASVQSTTVNCGGREWVAFGATLFQLPRNQLLTVWDGVYYVLTRVK